MSYQNTDNLILSTHTFTLYIATDEIENAYEKKKDHDRERDIFPRSLSQSRKPAQYIDAEQHQFMGIYRNDKNARYDYAGSCFRKSRSRYIDNIAN